MLYSPIEEAPDIIGSIGSCPSQKMQSTSHQYAIDVHYDGDILINYYSSLAGECLSQSSDCSNTLKLRTCSEIDVIARSY